MERPDLFVFSCMSSFILSLCRNSISYIFGKNVLSHSRNNATDTLSLESVNDESDGSS